MPNDLIERVARILSKFSSPEINPDGLLPHGKPVWTMMESNARKIIVAIREPTERMVQAGDPYSLASEYGDSEYTRTVWRSMIDAELGVEPSAVER